MVATRADFCRSSATWSIQLETLTTVGPWPVVPTARRTPSAVLQKRIDSTKPLPGTGGVWPGPSWNGRGDRRTLAPRPSVPDPRPHLLRAVLTFVRSARSTPGVLRIALLGSLATDKLVPKDADVLVSVDADVDLDPLARLGRRIQRTAQTINLGADIFLADRAGHYLGRICHYRECRPRVACRALLRSAAAPE